MIRIAVFPNGSRNGKLVDIHTTSWAKVLHDIRLAFMDVDVDVDISRIFTHDGTQINCASQLKEGQTVFVSEGQDFINFHTESDQQPDTFDTESNECSQSQDNEGPNGTIDSLPDEIIEMILKQLSVKDLLRVRLSSRRCLPISTSLCRLRKVSLRASWVKDPYGMDIFQPYVNNLPPWSSYSLGDLSAQAPATRQKFLQELGRFILDTKLAPNEPQNIDILQWTPNLRSLEVGNVIYQPNATGNVQLSNLKNLKLVVNQESIELLEFLISITTQLQSLDINLALDKSASVHRVVTLMKNIPSITLTIVLPKTTILRSLSKHKVIHKLDLQVKYTQLTQVVTYISTLSQYLSHLNIGIQVDREIHQGSAFNPSLPILKTCKMDFNSTCSYIGWENFIESFSIFDPEQVPFLQKLSISACGYIIKKFKIFNSGPVTFESVTNLEVLNLDFLDDDWFQSFPNVKKMTVIGRSGDFMKILSTMTSLEHLVLKMKNSRPNDLKINDVFAGMDNTRVAYDRFRRSKKVRKLPDAGTSPILSLTGLRKFEFEMEQDENVGILPNCLEDSGVYFSLLKMPRLKFLRLRNVSISLDMEQQLKECHEEFIRE